MIRKNTNKKYSVLVMSRTGPASIRKFEVSRRVVFFGLALFMGLFTVLAVSVGGLFYYRQAYLTTENVRVEAAKYRLQSSELMAKLTQLEETIGRTARFAAKVETLVTNDGRVGLGEGPVEEESWLPIMEETQKTYQLVSKTWQPFGDGLAGKALDLKVDNLIAVASDVEEKMNSAFVLQQDRLFFWASVPSILPTRGWVTSEFGDRRSTRLRTGGRVRYSGRWHEGIDIAAPSGTPIVAAGDGLVTFAGYRSGYGKTIVIDHGNGISTTYAHCSAVFVEEGRRVGRGMIIAGVGNTGRSTGAHLHYEVHVDDLPVNPLDYIVNNM